MSLRVALLMLPGLVVGLTIHEFAHAWSASLLGDDFARRRGRVSLNPLRHLSPLGALAIFLLPFGWGRPVPINLYNFKRPRRDYLLTSLAGPAANLLVVVFCLGLMQITQRTYLFGVSGEYALAMAHFLLMMVLIINTMLAALNLLPLPPLDGSKIWPCIIPAVKPAGGATTKVSLIVLVVLLSTGSLKTFTAFALKNVMRLTPTTDAATFARYRADAVKALAEKRWADAESLFTSALAINCESHQCLYGRAIARAREGNWQAALDDTEEAIELHPDPIYHHHRARIWRRLDRDDDTQAAEAQTRALEKP